MYISVFVSWAELKTFEDKSDEKGLKKGRERQKVEKLLHSRVSYEHVGITINKFVLMWKIYAGESRNRLGSTDYLLVQKNTIGTEIQNKSYFIKKNVKRKCSVQLRCQS